MKITITSSTDDGKEIISRTYRIEEGDTLSSTVDEFIDDSFVYIKESDQRSMDGLSGREEHDALCVCGNEH